MFLVALGTARQTAATILPALVGAAAAAALAMAAACGGCSVAAVAAATAAISGTAFAIAPAIAGVAAGVFPPSALCPLFVTGAPGRPFASRATTAALVGTFPRGAAP